MSENMSVVYCVGLIVAMLNFCSVTCEPNSLECNEQRPSTLCLTKDYSTFDLPFRNSQNLIKIGKRYDTPLIV